jgi:hypothetical protein
VGEIWELSNRDETNATIGGIGFGAMEFVLLVRRLLIGGDIAAESLLQETHEKY